MTKAIYESIASQRKGSFSVPMLNDLFEKVTKLSSRKDPHHSRYNLKEEKDGINNEISIFSEKFFELCLRSHLSSWFSSMENEASDKLSEEDIEKILGDDRYRY